MTAKKGRWLMLGMASLLAIPATTHAQRFDFLIHPVDMPVATFAEEFNHPSGELLINTAAPTNSPTRSQTPWMGSDTFIIQDDTQFGTGNVVTRAGQGGDFDGSGSTEQGDLDLTLLNWGADGDPPPPGWINRLPDGTIDQGELDQVLLNWGAGDHGQLACLPWEVDPNVDSSYTAQADFWMPPKSDNPNVTNSIALGYFDNSDLSHTSFEEGRAALWMELYYTDAQEVGAHDAHYRVRAKDEGGTVDLFDSADEGQTVDLSNGFATLELAWKTSEQPNWRMYGAAIVDALGETDFIATTPDGMVDGPLADFVNQGEWDVAGVGFQMTGVGGMVSRLHAVPEASALALLAIGALTACGMAYRRRRPAASQIE